MSKIFLILLTFSLLACKNVLVNSNEDRLYHHVDSLITQVLNYEYNKDTFVRPIATDTLRRNSLHRVRSTFPKNPEPLILLNGNIIDKEELRNYSLKKMRTIKVMQPSDTVSALYGTRGKNGVILILKKKIDPWIY